MARASPPASGSPLSSGSADSPSRFLALVLLVFIHAGARAEEPPPASVEAEVDRTEITIGDHVRYRLTIEYAPGVELQKPSWGEGLEGFQILDFERGSPVKAGERWRTVDTYTLSTYTPEDYVLPPIRVPITMPGGATQALETQPITVRVKSVLPDDEESLALRDIKDPVPVFSGILTGRVLTAAVVAALIVALLVALWFWRRKEEIFEPQTPPRPEDEVALERLAGLRRGLEGLQGDPDAAECKTFAFDLSETMREYLERRFDFPALEMTTWEIREVFPGRLEKDAPASSDGGGMTPAMRKEPAGGVLAVFEELDLVKFAKMVRSRQRLLAFLDESERIVHATRRRERPAVEEELGKPEPGADRGTEAA